MMQLKNRRTNLLQLCSFLFGYLVYIFVGAYGFMIIESSTENLIREDIRTFRRVFKEKAYCVSGN